MRLPIFLLGFTLSSGLLSADQSVSVTPQTLTGWTIVGADANTLAGQSELTLPPGAQIARAFDGGTLSLRLATRPSVGAKAEDWPVVELGSAALIFGRNGATGRVLLSLDGEAPQPLPLEFALDEEDRSKELLTLTLSRQGSRLSVEISGQTLQYFAKPAPSGGLEIVVSAGVSHGWTVGSLSVTSTSLSAVPAKLVAVDAAAAPGLAAPSVGPGTLSVAAMFLQDAGPAKPTNLPRVIGTPSRTIPVAAKTTLEIFTPPAVRHGRGDTLRQPNLPANSK